MTATSTADGPAEATAAGRADTRSFSAYEWMLAGRYLRARRKEGFISVIAGFSFLGIMLGVATLIIVMAVMNGFRSELFGKILGLNGHVIVHKIGADFTDHTDIATRLKALPGVREATPLVEGQVMVSSAVQASGGIVRGMTGAGLKALPLMSGNIRFGTLEGWDSANGIAVGTRLANDMRVNVGQMLTLVSPRGASTPFGTAPRTRAYKIVAVFELGMSEYDRTMIFMPLSSAQQYFSRGDSVDVLEVMVEDPQQVAQYASAIKQAGGPTIHVTDWLQRNETFRGVLDVERTVMFIILSLIILVAALNIISGMMMLVKDKGRDIAILRTMGATKWAVMRVFLITGASIGVVGTIAGFLLGLAFCWRIDEIRKFVSWLLDRQLFPQDIYYLTKLPADIDPKETAVIVLMALALSVLATLYPSWRASKLDPVEALRYE